jgi:hypothetical protein
MSRKMESFVNLFLFPEMTKKCVQIYNIIKIRIYKSIILSVVLYGCETWSLTLREEHRLRVDSKGFRD